MSELEAARRCRDMLLRKKVLIRDAEEKRVMTKKIKEMRKHISLLHKRNKGL